MSLKRESYTLDALLQGNEQDNTNENEESTLNSTSVDSAKLDDEKEAGHTNIEFKPDFLASVKRIRDLKLEAKTKMDIGSDTNKKVMMISKTLGVNGYALIDVAVSEFLERNKKEIDRIMKQAMR